MTDLITYDKYQQMLYDYVVDFSISCTKFPININRYCTITLQLFHLMFLYFLININIYYIKNKYITIGQINWHFVLTNQYVKNKKAKSLIKGLAFLFYKILFYLK